MGKTQVKEPMPAPHNDIYGCKKRCLFLALFALIFVVAINVTLVFWFIRVLFINMTEMKYMHTVESGIQFTGKTFVEDTLVATGMFSKPGQAISVQGANTLTMRTTDHTGHTASNIHLGQSKLDINSPNFKVIGPRGKTLFSVDKDMVSLTANSLSISGVGGAVIEGSLQTHVVSADIRSDLVLEGATNGVQVITSSGVSIESRAGDILANSHRDINLITADGSIKFESGHVLMPTLKHSHHLHKHHHHSDRVYQLCICGNGELYLGEPDGFCETGFYNEMCRL